ncbi:hypothetical protein GCM10010499_05980 [Streptomyces thermoviolaceus subsp. apingens]|nr:hypothetical protein GCM10010499_05980 [Streptomyces thermoviolaceus subsp. apingens]
MAPHLLRTPPGASAGRGADGSAGRAVPPVAGCLPTQYRPYDGRVHTRERAVGGRRSGTTARVRRRPASGREAAGPAGRYRHNRPPRRVCHGATRVPPKVTTGSPDEENDQSREPEQDEHLSGLVRRSEPSSVLWWETS